MGTKSWTVTLIAFATTIIVPFANDHLDAINVTITEGEMTHLLTVLLGVAGIGAGNSILKKKTNGNKEEKDTIEIPADDFDRPADDGDPP